MGGQSIPALDYFLAPGVLKTFKKQFKQTFSDMCYAISTTRDEMDSVIDSISNLDTINININTWIDDERIELEPKTKSILIKAYNIALQKTDRITYQAMEALVHNLNTLHSRAGSQVPFSSINFGTDTSTEGRMVSKNLLLATEAGLGHGETPIFPISIFKVKEGVNYNPGDKNYDLFELACRVSAKRLFPNFAFLDAPFNLQYYKEGDWRSEVAYMGCRSRVMGDITDREHETTGGRGNLSFTSINLPRLGIKHGICLGERELADWDGFYKELEDILESVRGQLLERFRIQCAKRNYNFPFLIGQGVWYGGDKLKPTDSLKQILKHGTLTVGYIGLAETLIAMTGKHHGESEESQKIGLEIISFIRKKCDEWSEKYQLNFSLIATPGYCGQLISNCK